MNYEGLFNYAKNQNINIDDIKLSGLKAIVVELNDKFNIAMNNSEIATEIERKQILAHELGHCETNQLFYLKDYTNPLYKHNIEVSEHQATCKAVELLVTARQVVIACNSSENDFQAAEALDISEEYPLKAIEHYTVKNIIRTTPDGLLEVIKS